MSCLDPFDQFYALPYPKTTKKARALPALHIENLHKLEAATAALSVSDKVPRPLKSTLAKPREETTQRSPKSVRFSDCVQIKTIPARKRDLFRGTGMDLVNIIKATDNEFASLIGQYIQPDSPAPWQVSSKARWSSDRRAPTAGGVTRPSSLNVQTLPAKSRTSVKRSLHAFRDSSREAYAARVFGTRESFILHRTHARGGDPRLLLSSSATMALPSPASKVRNRLALLRYMRRVRQRIASERHSTALLRRRCQSRAGQLKQHNTRKSKPHRVWQTLQPGCLQQSSAEHEVREMQTNPVPLSKRPLRLTEYLSQRMRTYVDHIRDQRGPPKPLQPQ
ncbi:hypothetical protein Slin15195_G068680 [Septoria linicola]|uniref:Uncharacterized protein n=1 Tax=Septoria linicola TaxID=215465 RepID=A0A9Q9EKR5_9PEZI|nr:hypothetical protein Slin15195_G068680 [Septoria linicola]